MDKAALEALVRQIVMEKLGQVSDCPVKKLSVWLGKLWSQHQIIE